MSFYTDIVLAGFANIDSSGTLKEQYERYCDWCWGHGYGDCRYCIRKYHKLYIPLRIAEKQKELGLEITRGLEMISSKDKRQYDESTNRVNKLPELTNYIDRRRRVSFTSICEYAFLSSIRCFSSSFSIIVFLSIILQPPRLSFHGSNHHSLDKIFL